LPPLRDFSADAVGRVYSNLKTAVIYTKRNESDFQSFTLFSLFIYLCFDLIYQNFFYLKSFAKIQFKTVPAKDEIPQLLLLRLQSLEHEELRFYKTLHTCDLAESIDVMHLNI